MDVAVNKVVDNYRIDQSQLETQRTQHLQSCTTAQQRQQVNREFDAKQQQSTAALMETLQSTIQQTAQEMQQTIVRTVETNQKEQEKKGYEDTVRDHLRGFSRTIPSFLMAYGDETVTLANFDRSSRTRSFRRSPASRWSSSAFCGTVDRTSTRPPDRRSILQVTCSIRWCLTIR